MHRTETGASVVAGHIDSDGVLESLTAFNAEVTTWVEIAVLLSGEPILVPVELLREAIARSPAVSRDITIWGQHLLQAAMQNVMGSRFHSVPERTAFWLLLLHDRIDHANEIPITHDLLSQPLGVHRPSIILGLKELTSIGALGPGGRGRIGVRDRALLEGAACECYQAIAAATHLHLG